MGSMPGSPAMRQHRQIFLLAAVLLGVVLVASCGTLADLESLSNRIADAGYEQVQVNHSLTNGRDVVTVEALTPTGPATDEDAERIARIVWESYPRMVDELQITLNGRSLTVSRGELAEFFGDRDPALDQGSGFGQVLLIILLVVLAVVAFVVVLVIVLVRQSRRNRRVPYAPYPPQHPWVMYPPVPSAHEPSPYGPPSGAASPYGPPAGQPPASEPSKVRPDEGA